VFFPIQEDFSAGEISSRLFGKTNSPIYKKGVAFSENWLHLPQGPIRLRSGSRFLASAYENGPIRLIPFNLAYGQDYCLELGPGYCRVLSQAGVVQEEGPENVINGNFNGQTPWVTHVSGIEVSYAFNASTQQCVFTTYPDTPYQTPNGHGGYITHFPPPPIAPYIKQTLPVAAGTYNFSFGLGVGAAVTVTVTDITSSTIVYTFTGSNTTELASVVVPGSAGVIIEFAGAAGLYSTTWIVQGPISFRETGGGPALITGLPWTAAMLPFIQYAQDVSQGLFLVHPQMEPYQIQYDTLTGAFTAAPVAFLPATFAPVGPQAPIGTGTATLTISGVPTQSVDAILTIVQDAASLAASPGPRYIISLDGGATYLGGVTPGGLIPGFGISASGVVNLQNTGLTLTFSNGTFVNGDTYLFSSTGPPPTDWTTGNYPSVVEIWQSRLWLGGTPDAPATIWGSRTFNYYDFTTDAVPTEASPFNLTESTKGALQWIRGKQAMLVGTDLHEDIIVSADTVISALDAQLLRESAFGSCDIQALDLGDQVVYASRDFTKIRALNFNFDTQAWLAHDLTYNSREITQPGVTNFCYQRDPDNTIFSVISDGTMRMCTYDRLAEALAWSRYTTNGFIYSAIVTVDPTGGTLWTAVNRFGVTYIEVTQAYNVPPPGSGIAWAPTQSQFLDFYQLPSFTVTTLPGPVYQLAITGLVGLDGQQVNVITDGSLAIQGYQVMTGGLITMLVQTPTVNNVLVGLAYPNVACTTLPLAEGVEFGTAQGQMKRRTRIWVRLVGSTLPTINGVEMSPQRTPSTPMGVVEPSIEFEDLYVTQLGWDRTAQVTIGQPLPFPTQIDAVFGNAEVSQVE
jgi:hypothetical protein